MSHQPIVSLQLPTGNKYFSVQLKTSLQNEKAEYEKPSRLLVLSNVNGNFGNFQQILWSNRVINHRHQWLFEDGHLILLGNFLGKDQVNIETLWFIYALEEKAKRYGGHVHFILGDTEANRIHEDWRHLHPHYATHSRSGRRLTALFDGNQTINDWLKTKNVMEKIGNLLFVHAGIAPPINDLRLTIKDINHIANIHHRRDQVSSGSISAHLYNCALSLLTYNGYYKSNASSNDIDATLGKFNVSHIITGHVVRKTILTLFDGKIFNVGVSYASERAKALFIENEIFYRVDIKGRRKQLFPQV